MLFPKEIQKPVDKILNLLTKMKYFRHQVESDVDPLLQAIHSLKKLRQSRMMPLSKVCVVCICFGGKMPLEQFPLEFLTLEAEGALIHGLLLPLLKQ